MVSISDPVVAQRSRRAPARRGRPRGGTRSACASAQLVEPGEVEEVGDRLLHPLVLREHASPRPPASRRGRGCGARPRGCVRIDASGLRSSCDASDTNWRWRLRRRPRAGRASRSSCARGARPRRRCSGSGTRRWMRGAGDGLGLRPDRFDGPQRAPGEVPRRRAPTSAMSAGTDDQHDVVHVVDACRSTSASERCATSVTSTARDLDDGVVRLVRQSPRCAAACRARHSPSSRRRKRSSHADLAGRRSSVRSCRTRAAAASASSCCSVGLLRSRRRGCRATTVHETERGRDSNATPNTSVAISVSRQRTVTRFGVRAGSPRRGRSAMRLGAERLVDLLAQVPDVHLDDVGVARRSRCPTRGRGSRPSTRRCRPCA